MGKVFRALVLGGGALAVVIVILSMAGLRLGATTSSPASPRQERSVTQPSGPEASSPTLEKRLAELQQVLQANPQDVRALTELAGIYYQAKRYGTAVDQFAQVVDLEPNNVDARTGLAASFFYGGMPGLAIKEYRKAVGLDPNNANAHFSLAVALSHSGRPDIEDALAEWETVVRLDPEGELGKKAQEFIANYRKEP